MISVRLSLCNSQGAIFTVRYRGTPKCGHFWDLEGVSWLRRQDNTCYCCIGSKQSVLIKNCRFSITFRRITVSIAYTIIFHYILCMYSWLNKMAWFQGFLHLEDHCINSLAITFLCTYVQWGNLWTLITTWCLHYQSEGILNDITVGLYMNFKPHTLHTHQETVTSLTSIQAGFSSHYAGTMATQPWEAISG